MAREERLLVYKFMEFVSLDKVLHGRTKPHKWQALTWKTLKRSAKGAANDLYFLHHTCIPHIIHRDMESSDILLNHEMEAQVSYFEMAKLINVLNAHLSINTLVGTPRYAHVPPKYYQSSQCMTKGGVYSLGYHPLGDPDHQWPTDKDEFRD